MSVLVSVLALCHIFWWWRWWCLRGARVSWVSPAGCGILRRVLFGVQSWSLSFGLCPYLCVSGSEGFWLGGGSLALVSPCLLGF